MSESGAFVVGGGGFQRVRDNASGGFAAEFNQQKKAVEERQRLKQAEQDRRDAFRAEEELKQKASKDAEAAKYFREYHNNPSGRRTAIGDYTKVRFGYGYSTDDLRQAMAELQSMEMLRQYMPEKYAALEYAKADAATLDPIVKCAKCRLITNRGCLCGCFQVGKQYGTLRVTAVNGDSCTARCECGREGGTTRRDLEDGITVCLVCEAKEKD